jgi:hypothetical protein
MYLGRSRSAATGNHRHPSGFAGHLVSGALRTVNPSGIYQYFTNSGNSASQNNLNGAKNFIEVFFGSSTKDPIVPSSRVNLPTMNYIVGFYDTFPLRYAARLLSIQINERLRVSHGYNGGHLKRVIHVFKLLVKAMADRHMFIPLSVKNTYPKCA